MKLASDESEGVIEVFTYYIRGYDHYNVTNTCNDNSSHDDDVIEIKDSYSSCSYNWFGDNI